LGRRSAGELSGSDQYSEQCPQEHLGQQDLCELLIAKAGILREIDATEEAVSLLRRKIEFVADSRLRAWLTLELAKCYLGTGDYIPARRELNDVLPDMQDACRARQGGLILAQIAEKQKQPQQAESLCVTLLNDPQAEEEIRKEAFSILGGFMPGKNITKRQRWRLPAFCRRKEVIHDSRRRVETYALPGNDFLPRCRFKRAQWYHPGR